MAGDCPTVPYSVDASGNHLPKYPSNVLQQHTKHLVSATIAPVPGDPNLDPFYLERSLDVSRSWDCHTEEDTDVELEDLENEYFMSCMTDDKHSLPIDHHRLPAEVKGDIYQANPLPASLYQTPSHLKLQKPFHNSQDSCSSIRTDGTGVTPDLTPSSSFSSTSTYSAPNCPEAVRKATEQLDDWVHRGRSDGRPRFYLPAPTPDTQSRACTPPSTPTERPRIATLVTEPDNLSSETLTMVHRKPVATSTSSLRSKPLPNLPPLQKKSSGPPPRKKCSSPGLRTQIDPSQISPPSLMNPITMEPHTSPFDYGLFIPAHECPSPVPNPVPPSPPITRQFTNTSTKGRPSTSTSIAHGEQSVWEPDSDSESVQGRLQSRRGAIDTLRKVRSRVQLRRMAKSEGKLHADIHGTSSTPPETGETTPPPMLPHIRPYLDEQASASLTSIPDMFFPSRRQTLRLVAPSMASLPRAQSQHSNEKIGCEMDTSTAAAIQAQCRRRQRSNVTVESLVFSKEDSYDQSYSQDDAHLDPDAALSLGRPGMFKRMWGSLRTLNCRSGG